MKISRVISACLLLALLPSAMSFSANDAQRGRPRRFPIENDPKIWHQGTKAEGGINTLVLLGAFSDVSFTYSKTQIEEILISGESSAKAYLQAQLGYEVNIVLAGPYAASKQRSYYGSNDGEGNDMHAGEFIAEICKEADGDVDYSQFDYNSDGSVDNVYVIYAGADEADVPKLHPEYIWAHSWTLEGSTYKKSLVLDGIKVSRYACSAEICTTLSSDGKLNETICQIGSFCHEFMHPLGLVDLYDTDYEKSGGTAAGVWKTTSLMDSGSYNNDEKTPPQLNSIEREMLGTMIPQELVEGSYTIYPIGNEKAASYKITNPSDSAEYYLLECRLNEGWDKYIGGKGLLLYHIDKSSDNVTKSDKQGDISSAKRWSTYGEVNCRPDHQCADLVEADGRVDTDPTALSLSNISGVFFPQAGAYSIGGTSNVKLPFWSGGYSKIIIKDISLAADGSATFKVQSADSPLPPEPTEPPTETDMVYIIVQSEGEVSALSLSNSVGASVKWFFNGSAISDPSAFTPSSGGEIKAEITWADGTEDVVFKTVSK